MSLVDQIEAMIESGLSVQQALAAARAIEKGEKPKRPKSARDARATRLPESWQPDRELAEFAMGELGNDPKLCRRETDQFRDYWIAQPGTKGCKLDWPATYRRWIRTAAERMGRSGGVRSLPPARQNGSDTLQHALDNLVPRR